MSLSRHTESWQKSCKLLSAFLVLPVDLWSPLYDTFYSLTKHSDVFAVLEWFKSNMPVHLFSQFRGCWSVYFCVYFDQLVTNHLIPVARLVLRCTTYQLRDNSVEFTLLSGSITSGCFDKHIQFHYYPFHYFPSSVLKYLKVFSWCLLPVSPAYETWLSGNNNNNNSWSISL